MYDPLTSLNPCPCCGKKVRIKDGYDHCEIGCSNKNCPDNPRVRAVNLDLCVTMWNSIPNFYLDNKNGSRKILVGLCDWWRRCTECERYAYCSHSNKRVPEEKK